MIDNVYIYLWQFANYEVHGILLCHLLAPFALIILLYISRLFASAFLKLFAVCLALLLYFLPNIVNMYAVGWHG